MPVAISGANFGVAETGTICIVESEGNGRMCLTLPRVLVSVMGIEKVVPTWQDMEVFLQLLPRSSTAERMNPYTSFWTGVAQNDGPQEFHLVLLDNGRTKVLADPAGRQTLQCIRCSACLNICPVYERTGGHAYNSVYPGPIGAILTPQLAGVENAGSLPFASTLCGACYDVCPVKINIPEVLLHLRGEVVGISSRTACSRCRGTRHENARRDLRQPFEVRANAEARSFGPTIGPQAGRDLQPPGPARRLDRCSGRLSDRQPDLPRVVERAATISSIVNGTVQHERRREDVNDARAVVLGKIREALRDVPKSERPDDVPVDRSYRTVDSASFSERISLFIERVREYKAKVRPVRPTELSQAIADACAARKVKRLVVPADLPDGWGPAGVTLLREPGLSNDVLEDSDGVLTSATLGIAQTGTIVLDSGSGQGRRAITLLPDYHLCVIRDDQVVGLVPEAVAKLHTAAGDMPARSRSFPVPRLPPTSSSTVSRVCTARAPSRSSWSPSLDIDQIPEPS